MKELVLAALVASAPVFSQAADTPIVLQSGESAPYKGLLLPEAVSVAAAKRLVSAEAERDALKAEISALPSWWWLPVAVLAGAGIGLAVGLSVKK